MPGAPTVYIDSAASTTSSYAFDGAWAAVMSFNEEGLAVGVGLVAGENYAVTESCWSSLTPGAAG
jgi:hypothetical protein